MKLKKFAEKINALAENYPDVDVIYSADDESNSFNFVVYNPTVGWIDGDGYDSFISFIPESSSEFDESMTINSVCIN